MPMSNIPKNIFIILGICFKGKHWALKVALGDTIVITCPMLNLNMTFCSQPHHVYHLHHPCPSPQGASNGQRWLSHSSARCILFSLSFFISTFYFLCTFYRA